MLTQQGGLNRKKCRTGSKKMSCTTVGVKKKEESKERVLKIYNGNI